MDKVLATAFLFLGLTLLVLELIIRAQVNRHVSPSEQVGISDLKNISVWLGRDGLIARHKRLCPGSRLANTFRVLWAAFFAVIGLVVFHGLWRQH
jgi:hypothetical protein